MSDPCPHCGAVPDGDGQRDCGWEPYMDDLAEWEGVERVDVKVRPCRMCGGTGIYRFFVPEVTAKKLGWQAGYREAPCRYCGPEADPSDWTPRDDI